ncbi:MAG: hypothetical protein HQK58_02855 [Deltaproteobacteria bacterium]|nr:hypothetical protein [Deltaproteobacteria bacterium]
MENDHPRLEKCALGFMPPLFMTIKHIGFKIVMGFLSLLIFLPLTAVNSKAEPSQMAPKKKIVIIRYKLPPDNFSSTVRMLKAEMAANGYREGENIEYADLLTATGDQSSVPEAEAFVDRHKDSADAFVTCGWISMAVRNKLKGTGIPQVATLLFQTVAINLMGGPLDRPSGSNITTIYMAYPPEKILRLLKMIIPSARKYGVVYNSRVPADQFFKKWHEETTLEQRQGLELVYFDLADGVDKVMAAIRQSGVDAFGGGVAIRKPDCTPLFHMGIPVVGPRTSLMDPEKTKPTDEVIGHFNPPDIPGAQAGKVLCEIFKGKKIGEILPQPVEKQLVYVNLDAAKRLKINVPTKLLGGGYFIIK